MGIAYGRHCRIPSTIKLCMFCGRRATWKLLNNYGYYDCYCSVCRKLLLNLETINLTPCSPKTRSELKAGINGGNMVTAEIRVIALKVQPFVYKDGKGEMVGGESLEMRAAGFWIDEKTGDHYPTSLHMTVYPGHDVVPAIGDCIKLSVECSS